MIGRRPMHQSERRGNAARHSPLTTKIRPRSLTSVYFRVYLSYLYVGLLKALTVGRTFSSIKTSLMRLFTAVAPIEEVLRDQSTTPEVVKTSNASSMAAVTDSRDYTSAAVASNSNLSRTFYLAAIDTNAS